MILIWLILNISIHGYLNHKEKKRKILFGVLTIYWLIALLIFNSLAEDTYIPLLPLGYLALYLIGMLVINFKTVIQSIKNLYAKKVKGILYAALVYLILFSAFFFIMMRPNLIKAGENPLSAFIIFGVLPFLVLFLLGLVIIPLFKKKDKPALE